MGFDINSNFWSALVGAVVGGAIAIAATIALEYYKVKRDKEKALSLLKTELEVVAVGIDAALGSACSTNMPIIFVGNLPVLKYSAGADLLMAMDESTARRTYQLEHCLESAEESRRVAADLLMDQDSPRFVTHAMAYKEWLREAKEHCEAIRKLLKCEQQGGGYSPPAARSAQPTP